MYNLFRWGICKDISLHRFLFYIRKISIYLKKEGYNIPRIARKDLKTPFLHVMVQGVNKEYIFNKEKYIEKYLEFFLEDNEKQNFTVIAYCVMNNHAHFLIHAEDIEKFGKFMHKINLIYAQMYNQENNRCGVLFRNRYRVEPIDNERYLINCIKYIHNNPVKAKMVSKCEDYKYSSYNEYLNNAKITKTKIMIEIFGDNCDYEKLFKHTHERKFIDIEDEQGRDMNQYIIDGIKEFSIENQINTMEILSDRKILKELIEFLKEEWNIKYIEIQNFLEISRGTMEYLRKN